MRASELESREDFRGLLRETLARGWTAQFGAPTEVSAVPLGGAQLWRLQPLLTACFADGLGAAGRRFLRDGFAYTRSRWRRLPQWVLGSLLASSAGLRWTSEPCFWVRPGLPEPAARLALPGNRRVRTFDFAAGLSRTFVKAGFDPAFLRREAEARAKPGGPYLPVTAFDAEAGWMEEPLLQGFVLNRCPARLPFAEYERRAHEALREWQAPGLREVSGAEFAAARLEALRARLETLGARYGAAPGAPVARAAEALAARVARFGAVRLGPSHGDFQSGNAMVERGSGRVVLIDWEYAGERFCGYDFLVYGLGARRPGGLAERLADFLARGSVEGPRAYAEGLDEAGRREAAACFLLEELGFCAEQAASGPFKGWLPELPALAQVVERFMRTGT
ncbi:MAG: phosphotransferase [Planctomycetota bacterium]|nr:phosphotransferase [Planctomycetota bacterium]